MKKVLSFLLISLVGIIVVMAQPQKMTYQTVIRNSNFELVVNQQVGVRVSILEDSVNGPMIYRETHTPTTNANGLVTIMIGEGIHPYTNTLSDVNWDRHTHYLSVEIDPAGGTNYTIFGAQQLVSVPYAFYSESARYVDTASYALNAFHADTAYYLANFQNSDTSLFAYNADTAVYANAAYSSNISNTASCSDSARIANTAISANYATSAGSAATATSATYADSARIANISNTANYANTSGSAGYSDSARIANTAISANYATSAGSAATATSALYADSTQVADFAHNSDTAVYANAAYTSNMSNTANYSDSARISNYANSANTANSATLALTANYSDSARIANAAISANYATSAGSAVTAASATYADSTRIANISNYADSSDYNHLSNKPTGVNKGDILYWETNDNAWHIVPVGNIGETLTLDSNYVPYWHAGASANLPTLTTDSIANITTATATVYSNVISDGGSAFVFYGVCWDTVANPTTLKSHTFDGMGVGPFTSSLSGLAMGTQYHVRAYATNSAGTNYGNDVTFTTPTYPTVITAAMSNISITTATSGGNVSSDGGAPVIARGVCWSTSITPTIFDGHTTDGVGTGNFTSNIIGLTANQTYYLRAYATNSFGTAYGDTVSFTTIGFPPTVTTIVASSITANSAVTGGNVISDGGSPVTERGICYNTTGSPTMADNVITSGSGIGSFTVNMTGLTGATTYYVCAYAINAADTAYGAVESFTTLWACGAKIKDYDQNEYNTVQIGAQCWMKDNLRTTHYADGTSITTNSSATSSSVAYAYHVNGDSDNDALYGLLYNLYATGRGVSSNTNPSGVQGVCPNGWHVPSQLEWTQLTDYVSSNSQYYCGGNSTYIAKSLASTIGWTSTSTTTCAISNNASDNNLTGFNAMPAGEYSGTYSSFGSTATIWGATSNEAYLFFHHFPRVLVSGVVQQSARSVRCVKD